MSYGFSPASQVLELGIFKYIFSEVNDKHLKFIIDMSRYADNLTVHGENREELEERCEKLMHLFSKYSLFFENEIGPHTQIPQNTELEKSLKDMLTERKLESIYGQLWNLETDCLAL